MYEVLEFKISTSDGIDTIVPSVKMFLSESLKDILLAKVDFNSFHEDNDEIEIKLTDLESDLVFMAKIDNTELSTALYEIVNLLDKDKIADFQTAEDFVGKMIELVIESKINIQAVHLQVMAKALVRNADNLTEYADFKLKAPSYKFIKVSEAILKAPSPLLSLSFERIRSQITSVELYNKSASSVIDKLFIG
jgi:hypothetical protein